MCVCVCVSGRDVIGLAETGSGKTGAFALPILQCLLASAQRLHSLVLTPTRELAFQIAEQFDALGSSIGVKTGDYHTQTHTLYHSLTHSLTQTHTHTHTLSLTHTL